MTNPCDFISEQMGTLYACHPVNGYTRIRTPYLYPDGDVIDLFFRDTDGLLISDLGSTLQWLNTQTLVEKRTSRQRRIIEDVCLNHGVEFAGGALTIRARQEELALAVTRLAQAALRVADISFTIRSRPVASVTEDVADFLREKQVPFQPNQRLQGYSGRSWYVDFQTTPQIRNSLVNVLSTSSRSNAHGVAAHLLAAWSDLEPLKQSGLQFVSLFDDTLDVWDPEDFKLLERDSEVVRWTKPDEFLEKIAA